MNYRIYLTKVVTLLCIFIGHPESGFAQASPDVTIQQIMSTAFARCHSTVNGVKRVTFEPPTNEEFAEVRALGPRAVAPLAKYLYSDPKDGFTQLFAVKFLTAIGGPSTIGPLKRAFSQDQWEVTRAAALSGMFAVSKVEAKPYVDAARGDSSRLVRQRAEQLSAMYEQDK